MGKDKPNEDKNPKLHADNVHNKVAKVVDPNAIADPRTMMVVFRHTSSALLAMLTPQRFLHHALYTEVIFIEFP